MDLYCPSRCVVSVIEIAVRGLVSFIFYLMLLKLEELEERHKISYAFNSGQIELFSELLALGLVLSHIFPYFS